MKKCEAINQAKQQQQDRWIDLLSAHHQLEVIAAQFDRIETMLQNTDALTSKHHLTFPDDSLTLDKIRRYLHTLGAQLQTKSAVLSRLVQHERDQHHRQVQRRAVVKPR